MHAGYTNGFYASGPSYSAPAAGAQIGYRYSPLGRVTLMYDYVHTDSINANFYRDHILRGTIEQDFVPFIVTVRPELHVRQYNGVTVPGAASPVRNDVILALTAGAHYNFRNWIAATLDYSFSVVQTDFTYMPAAGVTTIRASFATSCSSASARRSDRGMTAIPSPPPDRRDRRRELGHQPRPRDRRRADCRLVAVVDPDRGAGSACASWPPARRCTRIRTP